MAQGFARRQPRALGPNAQSLTAKVRVLMVGAGGIGCELLKCLVLSGFGEVHLVDLDTIDVSNLNRQFLFGMQHVKKAKALVAASIAGDFNPQVKLVPYHANIKDSRFNSLWFKSFDLVFNALDNLDARRHVNVMCLTADVPLIESGTTGFNGQVQVIRKGLTECYDCTEKPMQKSFPVCTIRSTPAQPIHCIVWAKGYLFAELFERNLEADEGELDDTENSENAEEIRKLNEEADELRKIRTLTSNEGFAKAVFEKVFTKDIERLRSMDDMWKIRTPPSTLQFDELENQLQLLRLSGEVNHNDQQVWTQPENFAIFKASIVKLGMRIQNGPVLNFDKDDEDILNFVAAAANLRSSCFGINLKSKFEIKQMAGNIIPAIATTNAMTAGLCVLQGFKLIAKQIHKSKMVYIARNIDHIISPQNLQAPDPSCRICSVQRVELFVDFERITLLNLVQGLCRERLGYEHGFSISIGNILLYDDLLEEDWIEEGEEVERLGRKLFDLGAREDSCLTVKDEGEVQPRVDVVFTLKQIMAKSISSTFDLQSSFPIPLKPSGASSELYTAEDASPESKNLTSGVTRSKKRRTVDELPSPVSKKQRLPEYIEILDDVIEID